MVVYPVWYYPLLYSSHLLLLLYPLLLLLVRIKDGGLVSFLFLFSYLSLSYFLSSISFLFLLLNLVKGRIV